jgi:D-alanine-D-alanine ligase
MSRTAGLSGQALGISRILAGRRRASFPVGAVGANFVARRGAAIVLEEPGPSSEAVSAMLMKEKKIGVLMGGLSSEREISLKTGQAVTRALLEMGYKALPIHAGRDLAQKVAEAGIEVAFVALHGKYGEDGCVQGLLEILGIPYTGSGVLASAVAMNKIKSKELFRLQNLPTPAYYVVRKEDLAEIADRHGGFGFPVVVKPSCEGSSVGVALVRREADLKPALLSALAYDRDVLVERYIPGMEVSVAVLDGKALGAVEIVSSRSFYDYAAKYEPGYTEYHVPPRVSATRYSNLLTLAEKAHQALDCNGVTRIDLRVSDRGNEYLLEVNTLPGMTATSLVPKIAAAAGVSFEALVERILFGAHLAGRAVFPRPARLGDLIPSLRVAAA